MNSEFQEIYDDLGEDLKNRVNNLIKNKYINQEDFASKYEALKFNLKRDDTYNLNNLSIDIINMIAEELQSAKQSQFKSLQSLVPSSKMVMKQSIQPQMTNQKMSFTGGIDVFSSLAQQKQLKVQTRLKIESEKAQSPSPAQSKAGKLQQNVKPSLGGASNQQVQKESYQQRPNRGQVRCTYNEGVSKVTGAYNPKGQFKVQLQDFPHQLVYWQSPVKDYQFLNLTLDNRTQSMNSQFKLIEKILLEQLQLEQFDPFYSPNQDRQLICGRVINISTDHDDSKFKESTVGLLNIEYGQQAKVKLNLQEIGNFNIFEGEVIVAEGHQDNKKFNANKIYKPQPNNTLQVFKKDQLRNLSSNYNNGTLQAIVACGPFTVNNELSFEGLKDLMPVIKRERPQALIICGPFLPKNHKDIEDGDLKIYNTVTQQDQYLDHEELFVHIMDYIYDNLQEMVSQMEIIIVPSEHDILNMFPIPQPPFETSIFDQTKFKKNNLTPHLITNPGIFMLNDISFGIVTTDIIKDVCTNIVTKFTQKNKKSDAQMMGIGGLPMGNQQDEEKAPSKIDLVLKSMIEQRSFYPLYPCNFHTPIEFQQFKHLMFQKAPDILITPSELVVFSKNIHGSVAVNPGFICKGNQGGSYASILIDPISKSTLEQDFNLVDNHAVDRVRVDVFNI